MDKRSETLMLSGVAAMCVDCGAERIFVPVEDGGDNDTWAGSWTNCEFCCTSCDAAVFFPEVLENTGAPHRRVA